MIAHQLHLFAGFAQDGVIDNDGLVVQGATISPGYFAASKQKDQFSPVKARMVQEPVVGVFLGGNDIGEELAGPQRAKAVLDERQNDHDKEQRDRREALLFADASLVEERSDAEFVERLVDLGFHIEAMGFDFPLDGQ